MNLEDLIEKAFTLGAIAHMLTSLPEDQITDADAVALKQAQHTYPEETNEMMCAVHGTGVRLYWVGVSAGLAAMISDDDDIEEFDEIQIMIDHSNGQLDPQNYNDTQSPVDLH